MQPIIQSNLKLKSFSFKEELDSQLELEISDVELGGFDLFIGDNAQGKTRLFRMLQFTTELVRGSRRRISSNFFAKFTFIIQLDDKKSEEVGYEIKILPTTEGNDYWEKITKGKSILFSKEEKILINEDTNKNIDNFFLPPNIPSISAIDDPRFKTLKLIREFFYRVLFMSSHRGQQFMELDSKPANALILNSEGTNLVSVLSDWSKKKQPIYQDLINDFKRCFPIIEEVKFVPQVVSPQIKTELLAIHEKDISKDILQGNWSEGVWRALCLLCLPKTQFEFGDKVYSPSMICIDEIENSFDFKTLGFITNYFKDYSDQIQVIMSSHSPIMSEFIHPKNWQIVKRHGAKIKISKPIIVEANLDEQLSLFREKYWDFYTKHVSSSSLYEPK